MNIYKFCCLVLFIVRVNNDSRGVLGLTQSRRLPAFFTFLYFHLITSNFLYFQLEARYSQHLEWENHSAWVLSWQREFAGRPLTEFWRHILSGCQVCDWGIQYHLCSIYRGLWGWWLSGCRSSLAERWWLKPEVSWVRLPAAAGLFHFPLFSPHNI